MLDYLGHAEAGRALEQAVVQAVREGQTTLDVGGTMTTSEVGDLLARTVAGSAVDPTSAQTSAAYRWRLTEEAVALKESDLIYDWNRAGGSDLRPARGRVELDDETLRDGLQSPSVRSPSIEDKLRILHLIAELGIETADIGLPGAGPHVECRRPAPGPGDRRAAPARSLRTARRAR